MKLFILFILILCSCAMTQSKFSDFTNGCFVPPGTYKVTFKEAKSNCNINLRKFEIFPNIEEKEYIPCERITKHGTNECNIVTQYIIDPQNNNLFVTHFTNCYNFCIVSLKYKFEKIK